MFSNTIYTVNVAQGWEGNPRLNPQAISTETINAYIAFRVCSEILNSAIPQDILADVCHVD